MLIIVFYNKAKFKYSETATRNQYFIHEEIKRKLNSENVCYKFVQNLLSSHLFSNIETMCVVLYGCET
jgi:hypothetical protein